MKSNPFEFIDTVIDPIPVVGRMWADALYIVLGLSDAYNLRHLRSGIAPVPNAEMNAENVVELGGKRAPLALAKAA